MPVGTSTTSKFVLVTGGAGFVGSHLVDRLLEADNVRLTVIDNLHTGRKANIAHWLNDPRFTFIQADVRSLDIKASIETKWSEIYHLACPASPPHYQEDAIATIETCVIGTRNIMEVAKATGARVLFASTSEVYGDPQEHPQREDYWGHVNSCGLRSCYDEGKRCAESLLYAYARQYQVPVRVARIFNTYGPRMDENDGRVVSNFVVQALKGEPLSIYGTGQQTRSFQYVADLVNGLTRLMKHENWQEPVNIGNPQEYSILKFAELIKELTGSASNVIHTEEAPDDPKQRCPDISRAKAVLDWEPRVDIKDGLRETIEYFRQQIN